MYLQEENAVLRVDFEIEKGNLNGKIEKQGQHIQALSEATGISASSSRQKRQAYNNPANQEGYGRDQPGGDNHNIIIFI